MDIENTSQNSKYGSENKCKRIRGLCPMKSEPTCQHALSVQASTDQSNIYQFVNMLIFLFTQECQHWLYITKRLIQLKINYIQH